MHLLINVWRFQENENLNRQTMQLNEYYESLRNNFISLLDHVRLPNFVDEKPTPDNFDSYLNKVELCHCARLLRL